MVSLRVGKHRHRSIYTDLENHFIASKLRDRVYPGGEFLSAEERISLVNQCELPPSVYQTVHFASMQFIKLLEHLSPLHAREPRTSCSDR